MDLSLTADDLAFRDEVRAFLAEKFTPDLRAESERQSGIFAEAPLALSWWRILHEKGWIGGAWPKEYGGPGWTPMQRYLFDMECAEAGTPILPAMGVNMCGPVIMRYGTQAQKDYFLPRIRSSECYFCQGYSEPGSGSDLASLRTRAVRDGDDYVINGSKIWTTHAHYANWIFMLVRTNFDVKPQAGISFLLVPMNTPGITVRPIRSTSGDHEVNEVFFDDVRTPVANRVGEENDGWSVAKYLLEFERGGGSGSGFMRAALVRLQKIAMKTEAGNGRTLWEDDAFRERICELEIKMLAVAATERRVLASTRAGQSVGDSVASMLKLAVSDTAQKMAELGMEAAGYYAAPQHADPTSPGAEAPIGPAHLLTATARYLNTRAMSIFGGSSEVQHNILARVALGL